MKQDSTMYTLWILNNHCKRYDASFSFIDAIFHNILSTRNCVTDGKFKSSHTSSLHIVKNALDLLKNNGIFLVITFDLRPFQRIDNSAQ